MNIHKMRGMVAAVSVFAAMTVASPVQAQMPDLGALFGGGQQQANPFAGQQGNPFAGQQANAWTNMMAPLGMMGGGSNPMTMMVNPSNWLNPNAYAQFANPMSYLSMMNPMSYMSMMNPMTYLPMMNPNSYIQMFNPALGLAGKQPVGNIPAIDPNTYWQFVAQMLGGLHAKPETSANFLDKLKELGEGVTPQNDGVTPQN